MSRAGVRERSAAIFARSRWVSRDRVRRGDLEIGLEPDGPPSSPTSMWRLAIVRPAQRDASGRVVRAEQVEQRGARRKSQELGPMRRCGFVRLPSSLVADAYVAALLRRGQAPDVP